MQNIIYISGLEGRLETITISNDKLLKGISVIVHPNPNLGGSNTNKVVQTVAKSLNKLGYYCFLPNLRGVGKSEGVHDFGKGEVDDIMSIIQYAQKELGYNLPIVLAGFSFGAYVSIFVSHKIQLDKLILIGAAVAKYKETAPIVANSEDTLLIHGFDDEVISLNSVVKWSELQNIPIIVIPGAGHFFHGKLSILDKIVTKFML